MIDPNRTAAKCHRPCKPHRPANMDLQLSSWNFLITWHCGKWQRGIDNTGAGAFPLTILAAMEFRNDLMASGKSAQILVLHATATHCIAC